MNNFTYNNIFDAITEDSAKAAALAFRADLMLSMRKMFEAQQWGQSDIMEALDISQPRASELMCGKVDKVSSDKLIGYLSRLGVRFKPVYQQSSHKPPIKCIVQKA